MAFGCLLSHGARPRAWDVRGDEFAAAMRERNHSKVGRMARLKGAVETVEPRAMRLAAEVTLPRDQCRI
jgi:hypothetical protein